jgi:hypothetical protein
MYDGFALAQLYAMSAIVWISSNLYKHQCVFSSICIAHVAYTAYKSVYSGFLLWPFSLLTFTSICFHANQNKYMYFIDKVLAYILGFIVLGYGHFCSFVFILCHVQSSYDFYSLVAFWCLAFYFIWIYFISNLCFLSGQAWKPWHVSAHLSGSVCSSIIIALSDRLIQQLFV